MSYENRIAVILKKALSRSLGPESPSTDTLEQGVEIPKDRKNGDYAFPCFRLAKLMKKNPAQIAAELSARLNPLLEEAQGLTAVSVTGPYLNFRIDKSELAAKWVPAILNGAALARRPARQKRVMIEYSQPNTHKAFHVGHTRNVSLGDALVRIFEWNGYEVVAANYIGDEGAHIAKCLWYFRQHFSGRVPEKNRGEFLGDLYTRATLLLDFSLLTRCPLPRVGTARVLDIQPFRGAKKLRVVRLETGAGRARVICGGVGYREGDIVAYAAEGARIGGRLIGRLEKDGIQSRGMICSGKELGLCQDWETIYRFPPQTKAGMAVAEYFRIDGALPESVPVLQEMERRARGVADILKALEAREPEIDALWRQTKGWSMEEFQEIYDWLDVRFDHIFYESDVGNAGKQIVLDYYERGLLVKSEGAIGADLADAGLPFLLLIKSDGSGLYAAKDIALAQEKFEKFHIDKSVYVVDSSQSLHFQQVFKTLEKMGYQKAEGCYHLAYGLVVLPEGKMSSRSGNVILFSELRQGLDEKIRTQFLDKYRGLWPEREIEAASRHIAIATIKYGMVNQDNLKNIVFDLDEWTARTGNTGPYLMYAYARTRSILRESGDIDRDLADWSLLTHETEATVLTRMSRFHEVAAAACSEYRPQWLCIYLYQLAKDFSRMYDHCSVIKAASEPLKVTRALLVDAVGGLLKQGLALLGIETLERM